MQHDTILHNTTSSWNILYHKLHHILYHNSTPYMIDVDWCWLMLTDVDWCWLMLTDVDWCWLIDWCTWLKNEWSQERMDSTDLLDRVQSSRKSINQVGDVRPSTSVVQSSRRCPSFDPCSPIKSEIDRCSPIKSEILIKWIMMWIMMMVCRSMKKKMTSVTWEAAVTMEVM